MSAAAPRPARIPRIGAGACVAVGCEVPWPPVTDAVGVDGTSVGTAVAFPVTVVVGATVTSTVGVAVTFAVGVAFAAARSSRPLSAPPLST
mgnify:CR=1 FL=1